MRNYFNLPAPQVPQNALLDFSGINAGIDAYRDQNNFNRQQTMREGEIAYQRGRDAKQDARTAEQDRFRYGEALAKRADAIGRLPPEQRAPAWQDHLAQHKRYFPDDQLDAEDMDPNLGPARYAAAFGGIVRDPREDQAAALDMQYKQAQINALTAKQDDPVQALLLEKLRGRGQPQAQHQQPGATLQPQSYEGAIPQPGLINVADQTPAPAWQPEPDAGTIDTPFGKMTPDEARDMAGPMLLSPKYAAAGKTIMDAVQSSGSGGLAKPTVNQLEEKTMNAAGQLARIGDIKNRFQSQFLQVPTRMQMLANSWTAKAGGKLSAEQQKSLSDFAAFRSSSVNNLNTILKELSGAAVTPQEYERIQSDVPSAGTGIFDGDDPTSFKAKLDRTEQTLRSAIARHNFMRSKGLNFDKQSLDQFLSLDDVPGAYNQRGAEIRSELQKSGADPKTIDQHVLRRLKREFGI